MNKVPHIGFSFVLFFTTLFMISCSKDKNPSHIIDNQVFRLGDKNLYCSIAVPYDYNELDKYPLLLALHWGEPVNFESGDNFLYSFILPALEDFNGIIISPSCPENSGWIHENSQEFIFTLIDKIKTDYNIDTSKVAITGYSMGGIGTWYYAAEFPDLFSLAIPISCMPPRYILPIDKINPTRVIHGTSDELFPINNVRDLVRDIKIKNNIITLIEVENAGHYETEKYQKSLSEVLDWIEDKWDS